MAVAPLIYGYLMKGAGKATAEALLEFTAPHWHGTHKLWDYHESTIA